MHQKPIQALSLLSPPKPKYLVQKCTHYSCGMTHYVGKQMYLLLMWYESLRGPLQLVHKKERRRPRRTARVLKMGLSGLYTRSPSFFCFFAQI